MLTLTDIQQAELDVRLSNANSAMFPFTLGTLPWETGNRIRRDYEYELWTTKKNAVENYTVDGSIGTAANVVDDFIFLIIPQTFANRDLTIPNPTVTSNELNYFVCNTGNVSFNINTVTLKPTFKCRFYWNVSLQAWQAKEIDLIEFYVNQLSIYTIYSGGYVSVLEIISSPVVGAGQQLAISSSQVISVAIPAKIVDLTATQYCWISYGETPSVAKPTGYLLSPNMPYRIGIAYGDKIAVIRDSSDGTLTICPVIPNV